MEALKNLDCIGNVAILSKNESLDEFIKTKEVIFIRLKHYIGKELLAQASKLKVICSPTTGLNHIDCQAAEDKGIKIISLRGEETFLKTIRATPEHIVGMTISLLRNYHRVFNIQTTEQWDRSLYKGEELYSNKIGIIGFGRVGRIISQYFQAFEAEIFAYDIKKSYDTSSEIKWADSIVSLIKRTNIIILCASFEGQQIVSQEMIEHMKDKYFINAARGELVDEEYLITKVQQDWFKGVGIDVIQNETKHDNNIEKLLSLSKTHNLIVTPHIGGATQASMNRTEEFVVSKLKDQMESI